MKQVTRKEFGNLVKSGSATSDLVLRKQMIAKAEADSTEARQLRFTITNDVVDRDQDVLAIEGWRLDNYRRNPVVLFNHDPRLVIGRCVDIHREGNALKATVAFLPAENPEFGQLAEGVYQACRDGYLNATSVGAAPLVYEPTKDQKRGAYTDDPGYDFLESELYEFSVVAIPANPDALIERSIVAETEPVAAQETPEPPKTINNNTAAKTPDKAKAARIKRILGVF